MQNEENMFRLRFLMISLVRQQGTCKQERLGSQTCKHTYIATYPVSVFEKRLHF